VVAGRQADRFSSSGRHAGYATEIYVITADALGRFGSDSALRRLTFTLDDRSGRNNYAPAWSPDGKQIAFTSDRDGDGVWVMNVDGSGQVRLADPQLEATSPCWLPIVTATNAIPPGWQQITGRYVTFRVPKSWSPTEVEPFGGGILEDWRLGIPGLESDQGLGFSSVDFEQLRPSDAISQVAFTLGGKAGVKYLRSGENGVSYDYDTVGHDDQGSFGIHVSIARFDPELEQDLDRLARSVVFR
jgi:hypothetical protein